MRPRFIPETAPVNPVDPPPFSQASSPVQPTAMPWVTYPGLPPVYTDLAGFQHPVNDGGIVIFPYAMTGNPGGAVDDAVQINAALARGVPVRLGPWTYSCASDIVLPANGVSLSGCGPLQTIIQQTSASANGLTNGASSYTRLRLQGLQFLGPGSGTGMGVKLTSPGSGLGGYRIRDVQVSSFGSHGIYINQPITSVLEGVVSSHNGGDGFHIDTATSLTSTSLIACYALQNTANGYYLNLARYCALMGCAADTNGVGYYLNACQGVTLTGCGAESQAGNQFYIAGGIGNAILGAWVGATASGANGISVAATEAKLTLKNCVENGPSGTASAFIRAATGSTGTLENCYNITANSIPAGWTTLA